MKMKKILVAISLLIAGSAFAADEVIVPTVPVPAVARTPPPSVAFLSFDSDSGSRVIKGTFVKPTPFGSLDANLLIIRPRTGAPAANGFEVGYGNGTKFGNIGLRGRLAYGDTFSGNASYYWLGAEVSVPVTPQINVFAAARHRGKINSTVINSNRYTVGADYAFSKTWSARAGVYQNRAANGVNRNGFTTAVLYRF